MAKAFAMNLHYRLEIHAEMRKGNRASWFIDAVDQAHVRHARVLHDETPFLGESIWQGDYPDQLALQ